MTTEALKPVKTYKGKKVDLEEVDARIAREAADSMRLISSILGSHFSTYEPEADRNEKQAQNKPGVSPTWITPGSAEGDLETVEENLKLQEEKKKGARK